MTEDGSDHYFRIEPHKPGAGGFRKFDAKTNLEIPTGSKFAEAHQKQLDREALRRKKKSGRLFS